jgi:glutaredoxin
MRFWQGLDLLRELKDALIDEPDEPIDVSEVIELLNLAGDESGVEEDNAEMKTVDLDDSKANELRDYLVENSERRSVKISVTLDETCPWASVRWFQAISSIETVGQVFSTAPSANAIEEGTAGHQLEAIFGTGSDDDTIQSLVTAIEDVNTCSVEAFEVPEESESAVADPESLKATGTGKATKSKQTERTATIRSLRIGGAKVQPFTQGVDK